MRELIPLITAWTCVLITAIGAVTDFRTGKIPNWLTFPAILVGPFIWGWYGGASSLWTTPMFASALGSVLSALVCGGALYFGLYRNRIGGGEHAIGAGDIKLFAALGSLGLVWLGVESMFHAVSVGVLFTMARLAWRGVLLETLSNAAFILVNPVLPKKHRREIAKENLTKMRFGVSIFVGTLFSVASERGYRWF